MEKYLTRLDAPQVPPHDSVAIAQGLTAELAQLLFPLSSTRNAFVTTFADIHLQGTSVLPFTNN